MGSLVLDLQSSIEEAILLQETMSSLLASAGWPAAPTNPDALPHTLQGAESEP